MVYLTTLSPNSVTAILDETLAPEVTLLDLAAGTPLLWDGQRGRVGWGRRVAREQRVDLWEMGVYAFLAMNIFTNKVALVTDGTSGIGSATAIAFAREGAKVVVSGRREKEGNEIVSLIKKNGGEGIFVKADVSSEADVSALVARPCPFMVALMRHSTMPASKVML